jgi:hypothetical protein
MSTSDTETGECHVCETSVPIDGEQGIRRFGNVLCRDCSDKPVIFVARCENGLCSWSYRAADTEFNRGHAKTLAQQEANSHQKRKRMFDDDPTHRTTVEERTE